MSHSKDGFQSEIMDVVKLLNADKSSFDYLYRAFEAMQLSTSVNKFPELLNTLEKWSEAGSSPLMFFLTKSSVRLPPEALQEYPETVSQLERLKAIWGDRIQHAEAIMKNPLGLNSISDRFHHKGTAISSVVIERNDGTKLEFMFDGGEVAYLVLRAMNMLSNFLDNGDELGEGRIDHLQKRIDLVRDKLQTHKDQLVAKKK